MGYDIYLSLYLLFLLLRSRVLSASFETHQKDPVLISWFLNGVGEVFNPENIVGVYFTQQRLYM